MDCNLDSRVELDKHGSPLKYGLEQPYLREFEFEDLDWLPSSEYYYSSDDDDDESNKFYTNPFSEVMKRSASSEQVDISSDDSSHSDAENDISNSEQPNDEPTLGLSSEAWLFRRARSYQEYMKSIKMPTNRATIIPYTSWTGLGSSIKQIYEQPLHYLTNIHLKRMDRERVGADDEDVPLEVIIHPCKAEATIWLIEEVHRRTSSPHHLAQLWAADPMYHASIDAIFPKLES